MSTPKLSNPQSTIEDETLSKKGSSGAGNEKDSSSERSARSPSQEPVKCAICLGDVVDRSCSNNCGHEFCFGCLLEWSKVKPECPLCKVSFRAIYHNFRDNDHDEHPVPQPIGASRISLTLGTIGSPLSPTFRWAPFFQLLEATNRSNAHTTMSHAPPTVNVFENNIIFPQTSRQPASFLMPSNPFTSSSRSEFFGDAINDHRRIQDEALQLPGYQNRRRRYDRNEWVEPFGSSLQPGPVVFESMEYIRTHPNSITRLRNFLYREINVLLGLFRTREQVQMGFVYDLIIHLLNHYDIRSGDFRDMISTYFGAKTSHFQHELYHFMLSGMRMEEYDRVAQYRGSNFPRLASSVPPVITLDSDDESTIENIDVLNSNSEDSTVAGAYATDPDARDSNTADLILLETSSSSDDEPVPVAQDKRLGIIRQQPKQRQSIRRLRSNRAETTPEYRPEFAAAVNQLRHNISASATAAVNQLRHNVAATPSQSASLSRSSIIEIDPTMPRLEPEVPFSTINLDQFPPMSLVNSNSMIIDGARANAAISAVVNNSNVNPCLTSSTSPLTLINHNMTRPSVLTCSRSRHNRLTSQERLFEELERAIAVEPYSSPVREPPRSLATPDFPVLSYRTEQDNLRAERLNEWGSTFLNSIPVSTNDPHTRSFSPPDIRQSPAPPVRVTYPNYPPLGSSQEENRLYSSHSLADFTTAISRPPRPSCIQSSTRSRASTRTPPFRIELFPNGISSAEVMDLSRSAGLIPSSSAAATQPTSTSTTRTFAYTTTVTTHRCGNGHTGTLPVPHTSVTTTLRPLEMLMSRGSTSTAKQETCVKSEDELECLGSFPIKKKPPLAVITLSSDDEREPTVKPELRHEPILPTSPMNENDFMNRFLNDHFHDSGLDNFAFDQAFSEDTEPLPEILNVSDNRESYAHIEPIPLSPKRVAGPSTGTLRFTIQKSNISTVTLSSSSPENSTVCSSSKRGSSNNNARKKRPKKHKKKKHKSSKRRKIIYSSSSESSDDEGQESCSPKCTRSRDVV